MEFSLTLNRHIRALRGTQWRRLAVSWVRVPSWWTVGWPGQVTPAGRCLGGETARTGAPGSRRGRALPSEEKTDLGLTPEVASASLRAHRLRKAVGSGLRSS